MNWENGQHVDIAKQISAIVDPYDRAKIWHESIRSCDADDCQYILQKILFTFPEMERREHISSRWCNIRAKTVDKDGQYIGLRAFDYQLTVDDRYLVSFRCVADGQELPIGFSKMPLYLASDCLKHARKELERGGFL
jgi:hypothetical protein